MTYMMIDMLHFTLPGSFLCLLLFPEFTFDGVDGVFCGLQTRLLDGVFLLKLHTRLDQLINIKHLLMKEYVSKMKNTF